MASSHHVIGYLGPQLPTGERKRWNDHFTKEGIEAFYDYYKCKDKRDLELRFSEMFLLDRRGYVIDSAFSKEIIDLLDEIDPVAQREGRADTVVNERGVLKGLWCEGAIEKRCEVWFGK